MQVELKIISDYSKRLAFADKEEYDNDYGPCVKVDQVVVARTVLCNGNSVV
jgi:hypothetical protein